MTQKIAKILLCCVLLPCGVLSAFAQRLPDSRPLGSAIPCNRRSFTIPFEIRPDNAVDPIKEVELLVSQDHGGQWHSVGRRPATEKNFAFTAEKDGEFWFSFRTITLSGTTKQSSGAPAIRVLVDATSPVLTLEMQQQESGAMLVSWKAEDRNLQDRRPDFAVASSVAAIEWEKVWRPLSVDGKHFQQTPTGGEGRFLFWPENDVTRLALRAVIVDRAGNRSEESVSATIKPVHRTEATRRRDGELLTTQKTGFAMHAEPLQPPKPVRMTRERSGLVGNDQGTTPKDTLMPLSGLPEPFTPTVSVKTLKLLPAVDVLDGKDSAKTDTISEKPEEIAVVPVPTQQPLSQAAPTISVTPSIPKPKVAERKTVSPEPASQKSASERPTTLSTPPQPGKITGISLNTAMNAAPQNTVASQDSAMTGATTGPRIVVKWHQGDAAWQDSQIDVMRSTTATGPWFPVATNLPNQGEYWWYLSAEDLRPFYIMLQMRALRGGVHVDITKSPIKIDPKSITR